MSKPQKKSSTNIIGVIDNGLNIGEKFEHFKGGIYKIVDFATDTETQETLVIYKNISNEELWARPISVFLSMVEKDYYSGPRFIRLLL